MIDLEKAKELMKRAVDESVTGSEIAERFIESVYFCGYDDGEKTVNCKDGVINNKIHLCNSCQKTYLECDSKAEDIIFGNGIGNDNICACACYLPAADVTSVVHGTWLPIVSYNNTYKCSECGRLLVDITDGLKMVAKNYPYCHCGAKMDGGE